MQYPTDEWHQVGIINKVNGLFFFYNRGSKAIKSIKSYSYMRVYKLTLRRWAIADSQLLKREKAILFIGCPRRDTKQDFLWYACWGPT